MNVEELKNSIINNSLSEDLLILTYTNNDFLCFQYCDEIAKTKQLSSIVIEDLEIFTKKSFGFTSSVEPDTLYIYETESITKDFPDISSIKNLIIVCKKLDSPSKKKYNANIVEMPNLELWQVKDLAFSMADGCDDSDLEELINLCTGNIYRLYSELSKLELFIPAERKVLLHNMLNDNSLSDLTTNIAFDLSNAIIQRNIPIILSVYPHIESLGIEPFGLLALLYTGFRNVCLVQISGAQSHVSCGLTDKQFYAIKTYNCGKYQKEELTRIFKLLTFLDMKVKSGEFDTKYMIDYLITSIL